jgi:hypothetical protein
MNSKLATAVVAVMKEVKGIEKSLNVGVGNSAYKGVADKDVKKIIGGAMAKHGLCLIPSNIQANAQIDRWESEFKGIKKMKQQVFTEVIAEYTLMHVSGESMTVAGYGHGVDSQDKSAGKATTYALKNAMLQLSLAPTGAIDLDETPSVDIPVAPVKKQEEIKDDGEPKKLIPLKKNDKYWAGVVSYLKENKGGEFEELIKKMSVKYKINVTAKKQLQKEFEA